MLRTTFFSLAVVGLFFNTSFVCAQGKYNQKIKIGDPAPVYKDLSGVDGKKHSLADLGDKDVVVIVITCNECLFARDYEDRLNQFTKQYVLPPKSKVALIAINVNTDEENRLPKMIERANEQRFAFPFLFDETQKIARDFGATVTPEFFVLNKERKIVYTGSMDDNRNVAKVKNNYLVPAVEAALTGQLPKISETRPFGCGVQYDRKK